MDGATLYKVIPGYRVDTDASTPTLFWVGGVPTWNLTGGPFAGAKGISFIPTGYEELAGSEPPAAEWTGRSLAFEAPYGVRDVWPGTKQTYCSSCGVLSRDRDAEDLYVVVHRRTGTTGHFRVYCRSHLPTREWLPAKLDARETCPGCGLLIPLTGVCDNCG